MAAERAWQGGAEDGQSPREIEHAGRRRQDGNTWDVHWDRRKRSAQVERDSNPSRKVQDDAAGKEVLVWLPSDGEQTRWSGHDGLERVDSLWENAEHGGYERYLNSHC